MGEICYKGFKKGLICRDKQYKENTVFEEPEAAICRNGMHYCKNPFDVLDYYPLIDNDGNLTEFAEVEPLAEEKTDDNKKFCTTKLKIGAKLGFKGFVEACINFVMEKTTFEHPADKTEDASSGYSAQIGSSGDSAQIGSSGDSAKIGSSGDSAKIGSSGYSAKIDSSGEHSVVMCAGIGSIAKAKKGSWITLSEWKHSNEHGHYIPVCVKTEYVDGEKIKADTWYQLENGEFKEVI